MKCINNRYRSWRISKAINSIKNSRVVSFSPALFIHIIHSLTKIWKYFSEENGVYLWKRSVLYILVCHRSWEALDITLCLHSGLGGKEKESLIINGFFPFSQSTYLKFRNARETSETFIQKLKAGSNLEFRNSTCRNLLYVKKSKNTLKIYVQK